MLIVDAVLSFICLKTARFDGCFKTCSTPRGPLRSHYMVCSENHLFIVGIGPIRDKDL